MNGQDAAIGSTLFLPIRIKVHELSNQLHIALRLHKIVQVVGAYPTSIPLHLLDDLKLVIIHLIHLHHIVKQE